MADILLVEDDHAIAQLVGDHLVRAGHAVTVLHDGEAALAAVRAPRPALVVLDVMLPSRSGLEVCEQIRRLGPPQPVVLLLTARASEEDAVLGFEAGADDYVRKPFGVAELVRRIDALLGLTRRARRDESAMTSPVLEHGALRVDRESRSCTVGDRAVKLTPKELDLLAHLMDRAGAVLEREALLADVWGYSHAGYARTVDSHVTRIRKKLAAAGLPHDPIATLHGVGYRFATDRSG